MAPQGLWHSFFLFSPKHWKPGPKILKILSLEKPRLSIPFCCVCLQSSLDILNWRNRNHLQNIMEESSASWLDTHNTSTFFFFSFSFRQLQQQKQRALSPLEFELLRPADSFLPPLSPPPLLLSSFRNTGKADMLLLVWTCIGNLSVNAEGRGRKLLRRQRCLTFHACCHGDEIQPVDLRVGRFVCARWSVQWQCKKSCPGNLRGVTVPRLALSWPTCVNVSVCDGQKTWAPAKHVCAREYLLAGK